jgi:hypothetical protein
MLNTKIIKTANFLIKLLIITFAFGFIAQRFFIKYDTSSFFLNFSKLFTEEKTIIFLVIIVCMMLLNWALEACKWKMLIRKIEKVSFIKSFMAVWAGITIGAFTPNRTGEYFGRAFILEQANRWEGVFITTIGSFSQLLITLIFGTISGFLFLNNAFEPVTHKLLYVLLFVTSLLALILMILFFKIYWVKKFFFKIIPQKYYLFRSHLEVYSYYSIKELLEVIFLSTLRYAIFTVQFFLLMYLCHIEMTFFEGLVFISFLYLITTCLPTIALTELGVRGSVSIFLLEIYYQSNPIFMDEAISNMFMASFFIWFVNLIIPALIGGIFVFKLKFFRK